MWDLHFLVVLSLLVVLPQHHCDSVDSETDPISSVNCETVAGQFQQKSAGAERCFTEHYSNRKGVNSFFFRD